MLDEDSQRLTIAELEDHFKEITLLLYDTDVPLSTMRDKVYGYISPNITFTDPWQTITGLPMYTNAAAGFHCGIFFDFDIYQLNVQMITNKKGRCIVDGTMNLNQLRGMLRIPYTYPLRTLLVYDFVLTDDGTSFMITDHEEMWSFADLISNLPLGIGWSYRMFQWFMGYFFFAFFFLCIFITKFLPWSKVHK